MATVSAYMAHCPHYPMRCDDKKCERLIRLGLDIFRNPQGLSDVELAGIAFVLALSLQQRPAAVLATAIDAGFCDVMASVLGNIPPIER